MLIGIRLVSICPHVLRFLYYFLLHEVVKFVFEKAVASSNPRLTLLSFEL